MIAKVFRQADTEELGQVDPAIVPSLAIKVLGTGVKESEKQMIQYKSQQKAGMSSLDGSRVLEKGYGIDMQNGIHYRTRQHLCNIFRGNSFLCLLLLALVIQCLYSKEQPNYLAYARLVTKCPGQKFVALLC